MQKIDRTTEPERGQTMENKIERELLRAESLLPETETQYFGLAIQEAIAGLLAGLSVPATSPAKISRLLQLRETAARLIDARLTLLTVRREALLAGLRWWC